MVITPRTLFAAHARILFPAVITPAEMLFQPDVAADEEVTTAHLLDLQFRLTRATVFPGDGHHRPGEATHNRFERQFHREIEMRRDERTAAVNHLAAIRFEGIGRVVERDAEDGLDKKVRAAVYEQLDRRIISRPAAFDKPAAEHAIPALV